MQPEEVKVSEGDLAATQLWLRVEKITPIVRKALGDLIFDCNEMRLNVTSYFAQAPTLSFIAARSAESLKTVFSPASENETFKTDTEWKRKSRDTEVYRIIADKDDFSVNRMISLRILAQNLFGNHSFYDLRKKLADASGRPCKDIELAWEGIYADVTKFEHHTLDAAGVSRLHDELEKHSRILVTLAKNDGLCKDFEQECSAVRDPSEWLTGANTSGRFAKWWAERQCTAFAFKALRNPMACDFLTTVINKAGRGGTVMAFKTDTERDEALASCVDLMSLLAALLGMSKNPVFKWDQHGTDQARKGEDVELDAACKAATSLYEVMLYVIDSHDERLRLHALLSKHTHLGNALSDAPTRADVPYYEDTNIPKVGPAPHKPRYQPCDFPRGYSEEFF